MTRAGVPTVRGALADLASVAAGFAVRGRGPGGRRALRECVEAANAALRTPADSIPMISIADADALVEAYIDAGGDWPALSKAVNRHALDGSRGRGT